MGKRYLRIGVVAGFALLAGCGGGSGAGTTGRSGSSTATAAHASSSARPQPNIAKPLDTVRQHLRAAGYAVIDGPAPMGATDALRASKNGLDLMAVAYSDVARLTQEERGISQLGQQHPGQDAVRVVGKTLYYAASERQLPAGAFEAAVRIAEGQ